MSGPGSYWGRPGATREVEEKAFKGYDDGYDEGYNEGKLAASYASAAWAFGAGILLTVTAFMGLAP